MIPATGWPRFAAWVVAGGLTSFAWLTGFTIGIFLLPFAVLVIWLVARRGRIWPEILGMVSGLGVIGLVIAFIHRDGEGCKTTGEAGAITVTCGGLDPKPWLVGGLVLLAVGAVLYALARRRSATPAPSS